METKTANKKCISCLGEMPSGASKCSHCGSFQGYRRFVGDGNAVLALLVAFVAVLTPLISEIRDLQEEKSEPSFLVSLENSEIKITDAHSPGFLLEINIRNSSKFEILLRRAECYFNLESEFSKRVFFFEPGRDLSLEERVGANQEAWRLVGPNGEESNQIDFAALKEVNCILDIEGPSSRRRSYSFSPNIGQY